MNTSNPFDMETTQAERFIKVAEWLKSQEQEFSKNFKGSRSIIEIYNKLPKEYDKTLSLTDYVNSRHKANYVVQQLAMAVNSAFGFRYFKFTPKNWTLAFGIRTYRDGSREVYMQEHNNWDGGQSCMSIGISDLGNAREAYKKLLEDHIKYRGDDYDEVIGDKLKAAFELKAEKAESLNVGIDVLL
jgi:hypothetical protein